MLCGPTKNLSSSSLKQTSAHHKWQHLSFEGPPHSFRSCGTKAGFLKESGQLIGKLSTRRGVLQKRPKCCQAVSKLAEGGRSTASFVAFPTKKAHQPSTERPTPDHWQDRRPTQARFKWASFYLGLSAAAASLLRSNAKLVLAVSLLLAAYAMRSGVLDMVRGPFGDSAPRVGGSKAPFDDPTEKLGNQNSVKANAGASGGQQLAAQETPVATEATAMEVVRPVHFTEEGLRPVIEAAKREVRQEVVAAGVVGRLERVMRMLPIIQEAALASRDLAKQASGDTAAVLGVSTKINAEVVGLKRQVAAGLDALGRNLQTDLSEEVRKGAAEVAGSVKEDLQQMEGRLSRKVATSAEVLALHQRLDAVARLVEDVARTSVQLQAIPLQVDALQQQLSQRTLDPSELDLQRSELGALGHVSQQLQSLQNVAEDRTEVLLQEVQGSAAATVRIAEWGAEIAADVRNLKPTLEESARQNAESVQRLADMNQGLLDGVREVAERSVRASEEVRNEVGGLVDLQKRGGAREMERVLAEGLAAIAAQLPGLMEKGTEELGAESFKGAKSDEDEEEVDELLLQAQRAYLSAYAPAGAAKEATAAVLDKGEGETVRGELSETVTAPETVRLVEGLVEDETVLEGLWSNPLLTAVASQQSTMPGGARLEVPKEVEKQTQALFSVIEEKLRSGVPADVAITGAIDEAPPGTLTDASWIFELEGAETRQIGVSTTEDAGGQFWESSQAAGLGRDPIELGEWASSEDSEHEWGDLNAQETVPRMSNDNDNRSLNGAEVPAATRLDSEDASAQERNGNVMTGAEREEGVEGLYGRRGSAAETETETEAERPMARQIGDDLDGADAWNGGVPSEREGSNERWFREHFLRGEQLETERTVDARSEPADVTSEWAGVASERGADNAARFDEAPGFATESESEQAGLRREPDLYSVAGSERRLEESNWDNGGEPNAPPEAPILFYSGERDWSPRGGGSPVPDLRWGGQLELERDPSETVLGLQSERDSELLTSAKSAGDVTPGVSAAMGSDWVEQPPDDNWGERRGRGAYSQRGREGRGQGGNGRSSEEWDYDGGSDFGAAGGNESGAERENWGDRSGWQGRDNVNRRRAEYEEEYWEGSGANSPQRRGPQADEEWDRPYPAPEDPSPYPENRTEVPPGAANWDEPLEDPPTSPEYEDSVNRGLRLLEEGRKGLSGQSEVVIADRMFSDAEKAFEEALAMVPDDRWALLQLASALLDHGELKHRLAERVSASAEGRFASPEEEEWLQAILDQGGDPADVIAELREGSEELLREAGRACRDGVSREPRDTDALTLWGLALCLRGQLASDRGNEEGSGDLRNEADELFQAGVEKFEAALAVNPDLWTALLNWGFALRDRSRLRPITSVQRQKLLTEALDLVAEVADRGKKGAAETLMARQELPVLESELDMVQEAVEASQNRRVSGRRTAEIDQRPRRAGADRWSEL
ncbi:hypothetical protein KFL_001900120 [Klebsormidium nitens]|uniref:Uncharacterized protein n=1 Tax=Klebsormidium nitens TaxID=105231 RepID=A0A1Y1I4X1_KLENI|nr:hypothetical protein KFL_001900120 [Klebsormidium nitens]|eukprot:GAQ84469.1 hypothetical protein KFL_001900120 [Klebsormidium nitens]